MTMAGGVRIRDATEADLPRIVELLQQESLDGEQREDPGPPLPDSYVRAFREVLSDPRQRLLVAEADGTVVGTFVFIVIPNLSYRGRPVAQVENVVVDEPWRGRGIGEAMMRWAIDQARRQGCFRVQLTSNKARKDAHRFYQRLGFVASHEGFKLTL
jgi:GNAT superfamily N-acetyltransferase